VLKIKKKGWLTIVFEGGW